MASRSGDHVDLLAAGLGRQAGGRKIRSGGYNLKNLTRDTLATLDASSPVLVRMETLLRATLYARQDPQVAKELLTRLHARAASSDAAGHPEALATMFCHSPSIQHADKLCAFLSADLKS
jgi:hypothetical protein